MGFVPPPQTDRNASPRFARQPCISGGHFNFEFKTLATKNRERERETERWREKERERTCEAASKKEGGELHPLGGGAPRPFEMKER
jgi:hypothetical protein